MANAIKWKKTSRENKYNNHSYFTLYKQKQVNARISYKEYLVGDLFLIITERSTYSCATQRDPRLTCSKNNPILTHCYSYLAQGTTISTLWTKHSPNFSGHSVTSMTFQNPPRKDERSTISTDANDTVVSSSKY